MDLNQKTLMKVLRLLESADSLALGIETDGMRLVARKGDAPLPMEGGADRPRATAMGAAGTASAPPVEGRTPAPDPGADASPAELEPEGEVVRAPMSGTFYRAPSPGEPPFCEAGDEVGTEDTVGLIEVMKLFNSIPAGRPGRVQRFFVEDGAAVQAGQPILSMSAE